MRKIYNSDYFRKINKFVNDKPEVKKTLTFYLGSGKTANNHVAKGLKYELRSTELLIKEGSFNRYQEELLYDNGKYDFIHVNESSMQLFLANDFEYELENYYLNLKKIILTHPKAYIIVNNLEYLPFRFIGNSSLTQERGLIKLINSFNQKLLELTSSKVFINDVNFIANYIGLKSYYDMSYVTNYSYSSGLEGQFYSILSIKNIVNSVLGTIKKGVITDLDNTLWPGIVGDDGQDKIASNLLLRKNLTHKIYHKMLHALKESGFFVSIASKNADVKLIKNLLIKLGFSEEFFAVEKINWNPKSQNILEISDNLNISCNDLVFIDDNIREIEEVQHALGKNVTTVNYQNSLKELYEMEWQGLFEKIVVTETDINRNNNFKKTQNLIKNTSFEEFLDSLNVQVIFDKMDDSNMDRIVQLLNKTNQFNNFKELFTVQELTNHQAEGYEILGVSYKDNLGEEGIVSVIIFKNEDSNVYIKNWVLSCRVFKRGVEEKILDYVLKDSESGAIKFKKTERNTYLEEFLKKQEKRLKIV